jgi:hypothetical protein
MTSALLSSLVTGKKCAIAFGDRRYMEKWIFDNNKELMGLRGTYQVNTGRWTFPFESTLDLIVLDTYESCKKICGMVWDYGEDDRLSGELTIQFYLRVRPSTPAATLE